MIKIAYFAGGCFWHIQGKFDCLKGVLRSWAGYVGDKKLVKKHPKVNYELVCSSIGFIETVKLEYDDEIISYDELLNAFFGMHNPTSIDKQGLDVGVQYKSVIYYTDESQKEEAEEAIKKLQRDLGKPVVTELRYFKNNVFFEAEEYHQKYNERRGKACKI